MKGKMASCLQSFGTRSTKTKRAFLSVLEAAQGPLSAPEIQAAVEAARLHPNKTTVYRFLDAAVKAGELSVVDFGDGVKRYEHTHGAHHHHAVCTSCRAVTEVTIEPQLEKVMSEVTRQSGFSIERHLVEFFGRCKACV
jgi:Fe2+ or Zn2+ uptake regulation protein